MKDVFRLIFFISLAVCTLLGCSQPVGSIEKEDSGSGDGAPDFWFVEVVKRDYYVGDNFNRDKAYYITAFQGGEEVKIPANDPNVKTEIVLNPDSDVYNSKEVTGQIYPFSESGEHEVRVTYNEKTKHYRIIVKGTEAGQGGTGDGLGGGIYWPSGP